jgi:RHH-type proline utilization regulon transcriptional repressor/proline dehydrogenase/delta 1-pyrroline-5-carboxylate dehydrogenase
MLASPGAPIAAFLFEGESDALRAFLQRAAQHAPAVQPIYVASGGDYPLEGLVRERSVSTNTAAAGGNASLMSIG